MNKTIAVLGTGAIGSSVGADLTKAGHDVVLIDQWPAHVEAMRKGKEANVPTPLNEAVVQLTRQIQCGELKPARENLALLERMMR